MTGRGAAAASVAGGGNLRRLWLRLAAIAAAAGMPACDPGTEPTRPQEIALGPNSISWLSPSGDDQLWGIRDVVESEGTIWALTSSEPFLHAFRDGVRIATRGTHGPGPAEMVSPKALLHGPDRDAVTVWDSGLHQYVTYSVSNTGVTRRAAEPNVGVVRPDIAVVTFGDPFRMVSRGEHFLGVRYEDEVFQGRDLWKGQLYIFGDSADESHPLVRFGTLRGSALGLRSDGVLGPVPLWDGCPDGRVALLDPIARTLHLVSNGEQRDSVFLPWESRPLLRADRVGYLVAQFRHETNDRNVSDEEAVKQAERVEREARNAFSAEAPLGVDLKCGGNRAWVQEFDGSAHPLGYGRVWRTISLEDPDDVVRVTLPPGFSMLGVMDAGVLGVVTDSLDLQRIAAITTPHALRYGREPREPLRTP